MILTNMFVFHFEYDTSGSDSLTMFDTCMQIYSWYGYEIFRVEHKKRNMLNVYKGV